MDAQSQPPVDLYINRELSQFEFNKRVMAQALDPEVPLLERLRFLCITSTNLDEFFEIRVAALKQRIEIGGRNEHFTNIPDVPSMGVLVHYVHQSR